MWRSQLSSVTIARAFSGFLVRRLPSLVLAVSAIASAAAQSQSAKAELWFDIPAQPVASALDAYSAATGVVAAYDSRLSIERRSSAVRGHFRPDGALLKLLEGSGLAAQFTTETAFILIPQPQRTAPLRTPTSIAQAFLPLQEPAVQRYAGLLQAGVNGALCAQERTRPGDYRLAISFWIGAAGQVTRVRLLDTTGDPERDAAIADTLHGVSIPLPLPPRAPQPFTMVILPRSSGGTVDCAPRESGGQRD